MTAHFGRAAYGAALSALFLSSSIALAAGPESAAGPIDVAKLQQFKKSCDGLPTTITRNQIRIAFERKLFPGPLDTMGEFLERTERSFNAFDSVDSCSAFQAQRAPAAHPLFQQSKVPAIFKDVVRQSTDLLVRDMNGQKDLAQQGLHCAGKLEEFTKSNALPLDQMTKSQIETFSRTTKTPDRCLEFVTEYIPSLQDRFDTMRTFLAIGTDQVQKSKLKTDASALSKIIAPYFPTVWRNEAPPELEPLPLTERNSLTDLESLEPAAKEAALRKSYEILSTAPILATFSDTPEPKSIAAAFRILNSQMEKDIGDLKKDVPQEITLLLPYVFQALSQMPLERRGDACLIFQELHENLIKRYIKIPFWSTVVGLSFGGMGGATAMTFVRSGSLLKSAGQSLSQFVKGMSPAVSATMVTAASMNASNGLRNYLYQTKLCSVVTDASDASKRVSSLCDFGSAEAGLRETQASALTQAGLGLTIFGVARILK